MAAPKIGIIAVPYSRSSYIMDVFDKAGFELGDVDRRIDDRYPAGRLELWPLARMTSGKAKNRVLPASEWPDMDLPDRDWETSMM